MPSRIPRACFGFDSITVQCHCSQLVMTYFLPPAGWGGGGGGTCVVIGVLFRVKKHPDHL